MGSTIPKDSKKLPMLENSLKLYHHWISEGMCVAAIRNMGMRLLHSIQYEAAVSVGVIKR